MQYTLTEATEKRDFQAIASLAKEVWHNTYDSIIGSKQVDYMLEKFQRASVIENDVNQNHYSYLMAKTDDTLLGYCGIKPEENGAVFLSKVYVSPKFQGQGIAKAMILHFADQYRKLGYSKMWLTVNKGNKNAIAAYLKLGFRKSGELVTDIGEGYVMDDDTMELAL